MRHTKHFIIDMLSDNSGGISVLRVVTLLWMSLVFVVWTYVAFHNGTVPDLPSGVVSICGLTLGAKVIQRFGEKDNEQPPPPQK